MINRLIKVFLDAPMLVLILAGIVSAIGFHSLQENAKDAIPDISENQVIISTMWMGRSPQDIEDQIAYPLTVEMQGIPRVTQVRSISGFGFSRIYIVFEDGVDIYWARSRVLERLASAASNLPAGVMPELGPDATSLGQVFWYTVEGPYTLEELTTLQNYVILYALQSVEGVSEVATAGGMVREYQIEVDPERLRAYKVTLEQLANAVRDSNLDVGAKTLEKNSVEFIVRGVGFIKSVEDIEKIVVKTDGHIPVSISDVARVQIGSAFRRGILADDRNEHVGGVVTMRYGADPLKVIENVKKKLEAVQGNLPEGVEIKPFYDRSELIYETLDTLRDTLIAEVVITVIVVLLFLLHLRSALIISSTLPFSILLAFIGMRLFGVSSNIMSLAGIAIAIGTVVDMGIIMTENIYRALQEDGGRSPRGEIVYGAATEVGGAIFTAVMTTVISFIPIFALPGQSYKLFAPLAWTKSLMLVASAIIAVTLIPVLCGLFLGGKRGEAPKTRAQQSFRVLLRWSAALGMAALIAWVTSSWGEELQGWLGVPSWLIVTTLFVVVGLAVFRMWGEPLTPIEGNPVSKAIVGVYTPTLKFLLRHKWVPTAFFIAIVTIASMAAFGARAVLTPVRYVIDEAGGDSSRVAPLKALEDHYPGFGSEFMTSLDEGSLLSMPSLLVQASLTETLEFMKWQNEAILSVPEVRRVMGKQGRAETALDPAPIGMIETIVLLHPKDRWRKAMDRDEIVEKLRAGRSLAWLIREMREGDAKAEFRKRVQAGMTKAELIEMLSNARDLDRIRAELSKEAKDRTLTIGEWLLDNVSKDLDQKALVADLRVVSTLKGVAPSWLMPIETRLIMLTSGIKAKIGLEISGDDPAELVRLTLALEPLVKEVKGTVDVTALRTTGGKPYIEFHLNREKMKYYGVSVRQVEEIIEIALGGRRITTTVEGRERYPVRVRYERELRDSLERLDEILVSTSSGAQVPITEVADIEFVIGPATIRGINGRLVGYVMFNPVDIDETTLIRRVEERVRKAIENKEIDWPEGYTIGWVGQYKEQLKANERLRWIIPLALCSILLLVYIHFRRASTVFFVFVGVPIGVAGGVLMIRYWPYLQHLYTGAPQADPIHMTIAVIVGFIALIGIVVDDGVVICTYINQLYERRNPRSSAEIRDVVLTAGARRIRPTLMTTVTTLIALLPMLLTTARGSDVMQPMALPIFGGMLVEITRLFAVPVGMCAWLELKLKWASRSSVQPAEEP